MLVGASRRLLWRSEYRDGAPIARQCCQVPLLNLMLQEGQEELVPAGCIPHMVGLGAAPLSPVRWRVQGTAATTTPWTVHWTRGASASTKARMVPRARLRQRGGHVRDRTAGSGGDRCRNGGRCAGAADTDDDGSCCGIDVDVLDEGAVEAEQLAPQVRSTHEPIIPKPP